MSHDHDPIKALDQADELLRDLRTVLAETRAAIQRRREHHEDTHDRHP